MKQLLFIFICITLVSCNQFKGLRPLSVDVSEDIIIPEHYIIAKTTNDIVVQSSKPKIIYHKIIINNPYEEIFNSNKWIM